MNEKYLGKLNWSKKKLVPSEYGPRLRSFAKITEKHKLDFEEQRQKFSEFGIILKEHKDRPGEWYFVKYERPPSEAQLHAAATKSLSRSTSSTIPVSVPPGLSLMPYQVAGVEFMIGRKATLLGDSPGLGKTLQTIAYINTVNARAGKRVLDKILIACPESIRLNWYSELRKWLTDKSYTVDIVDDVFPSTNIVLIGVCSLRKWTRELSYFWDLVVIDEADRLSNPDAQMTRAIYGYYPSAQARSKGEQVVAGVQTKRKIAITGTPIPNKPKNIWTTLHWLDPVIFKDRATFAFKYFGGCLSERGFYDEGSSNEAEFQDLLRRTVMIRREQKDVLKDLPEIRRVVQMLPVDHKYQSSLRELANSDRMRKCMTELAYAKGALEVARCRSRAEFLMAEKEVERVFGHFSAASFELIHETGRAKVKPAADIIRMSFHESPKLVIATQHQDVTDAMVKEFPTALVLDGRVPFSDRHARCVKFQEDPTAGPFIITIETAVGLNLFAASKMFFIEGSWLPGKITQAEKRIHRIGTKHPCLITHFVLEGSIDLVRAERVIKKQKIIDAMINLDTNEEEREPVLPLPGVTLTLDLIDRRAVEFSTPQAIADVHAKVTKFLSDTTGVHLADKVAMELIIQKGFTPRTSVLAKVILESYQRG